MENLQRVTFLLWVEDASKHDSIGFKNFFQHNPYCFFIIIITAIFIGRNTTCGFVMLEKDFIIEERETNVFD